MPLPESGVLSAKDINNELGRSETSTMHLNGSGERALAQKPTPNSVIRYSDFRNKRASPAYVLIGSATNVMQIDGNFDSGVRVFNFNNISRNSRIRSRVWATISGSHKNNGPRGYAFVRWIIKDLNHRPIWDSTRIDMYTRGDAAIGIENWSQAYYINQLIGNGGNVHIEVQLRYIAGSYTGHIWGGQNYLNRICGIEAEVGY
ncbi:MAG: hypothetical protein ACRCX8_16755 [Sarcina sp.]